VIVRDNETKEYIQRSFFWIRETNSKDYLLFVYEVRGVMCVI
jgi:hypothetical protein